MPKLHSCARGLRRPKGGGARAVVGPHQSLWKSVRVAWMPALWTHSGY